MADRLKLGGNQLTEFGDLLKANAKALRLEMRADLEPEKDRIVGEIQKAAESTKVAKTVRGSVRGTGNQVRIVFNAGRPGEPLARLRETGNKGKANSADTRSGYFKHPVFAEGPRNTWTWTKQSMHPFFVSTIEANRDATPRVMREVVEKTWRRSQPPE